jgi:MarR family transcriptional regulator for hemolysin
MKEEFDRTLGFLLHDVARLLRKRFEQNARGLGLTRAQWQVLAHLNRNEGINQSALAEILEVEPITLARILDRLEASGFVERRTHATDRRLRLLHLTPAAHPVIEKMRAIGQATREEALAGIPAEMRELLTDTLLDMKGNLLRVCAEPVREAANG